MRLTKTLTLMVLSIPSVSAFAGESVNTPVQVYGTYAYGGLNAARTSADSIQYISCHASEAGRTACEATTAGNVHQGCYTDDPSFLLGIQAINESSFVYFSWEASGICSRLFVGNSSLYLPDIPTNQPRTSAVGISDTYGARGALSAARDSNDSGRESIGCSLDIKGRNYPGYPNGDVSTQCDARDSAYNPYSCRPPTSSGGILASIINGETAFLLFLANWTGSGSCDRVQVSNYSSNLR